MIAILREEIEDLNAKHRRYEVIYNSTVCVYVAIATEICNYLLIVKCTYVMSVFEYSLIVLLGS